MDDLFDFCSLLYQLYLLFFHPFHLVSVRFQAPLSLFFIASSLWYIGIHTHCIPIPIVAQNLFLYASTIPSFIIPSPAIIINVLLYQFQYYFPSHLISCLPDFDLWDPKAASLLSFKFGVTTNFCPLEGPPNICCTMMATYQPPKSKLKKPRGKVREIEN